MVVVPAVTYASATGLNVVVIMAKVGVAVNVAVPVGVLDGADVSVGVEVAVGVSVGVAVSPNVGVAVAVGVSVGVFVGPGVDVLVGVLVKVGVGPKSVSMTNCGGFAVTSRLARLSSVELRLVNAKLNVPLPVT